MKPKKHTQDTTQVSAQSSISQDETHKIELKIVVPTDVYCQLVRKALNEGKSPEKLIAEIVVELSSQKD